MKLIGVPLSPFVRKIRVACAEKGVEVENDPMIPLNVSDEYKAKYHPLGKIPTLEDGDRVIPDSSAILAYIEGLHPEPSLYPAEPYDRARAIWLEEYADTAAVPACGPIFFERVVAPNLLKQEPDQKALDKAINEDLPKVCDYLERQIPEEGWVSGGSFSIADISIGSPFMNARHGGHTVDASRWPRLAAYLDRVWARPSFHAALEAEKAFLS